MSEPRRIEPDFRLLFESMPGLYLVLEPDAPRYTIVAVSDAYARATMTKREQIIGRGVFDVFPDNPADPRAAGVRNAILASLERVIRQRAPDAMALLKYDIRRPEADGGDFEERWWSSSNTPVFGENRELTYIIHRAEDVTESMVGRSADVEARRQAEADLRRSEERNRAFLVAMPDLLFRIDGNLRFIDCLAADPNLFAMPPEMFLGRTIPEVYGASFAGVESPFGDASALGRRLTQGVVSALETGQPQRIEYPFRKQWFEARIVRVNANEVLAIARDITELKAAQDQIRTSQERFELALRGADLAAWDWNIESGEVIFSPRWAEMRGYRPEEIGPHVNSWKSAVHPDDWPHVQRALDDYFQGLASEYESEHRVLTKSGKWLWILDRGKVFARDEQGRPTRMVGTELDITERKRLEEELKRSENEQKFLAELGAILASTLEYEETLSNVARLAVRDLADFCLVDILEEDGDIRRLKVVSRDPSKAWLCDLLTQIPLDRRRPHLGRAAMETKRAVLMQDLSAETLASMAQSEEHLRALRALDARSVIALPLLAHGTPLGSIALVSSTPSRPYCAADVRLAEDLAQRAARSIESARLYRAAQRAIRARDEVLGIVAHDLRNPLDTILMQATLLSRHGPEPERRSQKPAEVIGRAANRMNRLIQDLLDVTRMEAGRLPVEQSRVAAGQVVSDSLETHKPLASSASIELRLDVAPGLTEVWADRDRLLQVFDNLIGNAIKSTDPGGRITVGAAPRDGDVLFWVADTGTGIAAEDLPHLFDRFWQARTRRRGAGLGLTIVKGMVEAHRGRIWVESTPGSGSTFFFTIPTAPRAEEWQREPAPHGP